MRQNISRASLQMRYGVFLERDEDGVYVTECLAVPGCISQEKTREESLEDIHDAVKGYLESLKKNNEPVLES